MDSCQSVLPLSASCGQTRSNRNASVNSCLLSARPVELAAYSSSKALAISLSAPLARASSSRWVMMAHTSLGFGSLVLGPLLVSVFVTSWRWPTEGARVLGTTWWPLMFGFTR